MTEESQIRAWRKHRRQSLCALPVAVVLLGAMVAGSLIFDRVLPAWLTWILTGGAAFAVLGDTINILFLNRKLRRAAADRA